jgi:hypothetical protein
LAKEAGGQVFRDVAELLKSDLIAGGYRAICVADAVYRSLLN